MVLLVQNSRLEDLSGNTALCVKRVDKSHLLSMNLVTWKLGTMTLGKLRVT